MNKLKFLTLFFCLVNSNSAFSQPSAEEDFKIRFSGKQSLFKQLEDQQFLESEMRMDTSQAQELTAIVAAKQKNDTDIDARKFSADLKKIKLKVCQAIPNSDVEFWVNASAGSQLKIINFMAESGIKVAFKCPPEKNNQSG